jgi:ferredoxin
MKTFRELYDQAVALALDNHLEQLPQNGDFDPKQLDCLLNPKKHPLVIHTGDCTCTGGRQQECVRRCPFNAIQPDPNGGIAIDPDLCLGCADCIDGCAEEKLKASTDILPALKAVRSSKELAYALIAPAFLGQFSKEVTPGKLRTALKAVGFDGMLEVALLADILTLKEALEFDKNIQTEADFQLTSCCCPMWIGMIRKVYNELMPHVPGSVSPMVACARVVKILHPGAVTVFIGPCLAKKAEARGWLLMKNAFKKIFAIVHRCSARSLPPKRSDNPRRAPPPPLPAGADDDGTSSCDQRRTGKAPWPNVTCWIGRASTDRPISSTAKRSGARRTAALRASGSSLGASIRGSR